MDTLPRLPGPPFMRFKRAQSVIGIYEFWGMHLGSGLPRIIRIRVSLPFDEVLECSRPSREPVIDDALHLVFFFPFEKVRWWSRVVRPMFFAFVIWGKEGCVEDVVNGPGHGKM